MTHIQYPNIPGYEIKKVLGKGGMGIVYLAIQKSLNRPVALKVTLPALADLDESFNQRFVQEANITASLKNANIITIYDSGVYEQSSYISMEYISTGNLDDINSKTLNDKQICDLFIDISRGLAAAHKANLVHRDIKPDNILINEEGQAIVTDFGIVKTLNANTALTKTGLTIGTPKYMSPEQILAQPLDGRADLYSVGIMLYDFLEGKVPFDDTTPVAIHIKHLQSEPQDLSPKNKKYQPIVSKLLMKDKEDRYNSANDLINALQIVASGLADKNKADSNDQTKFNSDTPDNNPVIPAQSGNSSSPHNPEIQQHQSQIESSRPQKQSSDSQKQFRHSRAGGNLLKFALIFYSPHWHGNRRLLRLYLLPPPTARSPRTNKKQSSKIQH